MRALLFRVAGALAVVLVAGWMLATVRVIEPVAASAAAPLIMLPAVGTVLKAGPDFATDVYGDPWDFLNVEDLPIAPFYTNGWTQSAQGFIAGRSALVNTPQGLFTGTTSSFLGEIPLLYRGASNLVNVPTDRAAIFDRFAIPTNRFGKLAVKINFTGGPPQYLDASWFHDTVTPQNVLQDVEAGGIEFTEFDMTESTRIYVVDLVNRTWVDSNGAVKTGPVPRIPMDGAVPLQSWTNKPLVRGLVLRPRTPLGVPITVNVDWVRVTASDHPSQANYAVTTPVQFAGCDPQSQFAVLATEVGVASEGTAILAGGIADGQGTANIAVNYGVLTPGNWDLRVRCGGTDSNPVGIVVNAPPVVTVRNPDLQGGADFSTDVMFDPWDMNELTDIASASGVTNQKIVNDPRAPGTNAYEATNVVVTTPTGPQSDPALAFLNFGTTLLSSRKYQNLTFSLTLETPFGLDGNLGDGSILRLFWASPGMDGSNMTLTTDMLVWPGRTTYTLDLTSLPAENLLGPKIPWQSRMLNEFRLDPHEATKVFPFRLGPVRLTAYDTVTLGNTFDIEYSFTDPDSAGSTYEAKVFAARDLNGTGLTELETISAGVVPGTAMVYPFDPLGSNTVPGDYYIRIDISETRNGDTTTRSVYSSGRLRVVAPTVSSPQTTVLKPAVESTQPLLVNISGCAFDAAASSGIGVDDLAVYAIAGPEVTGGQAGKTLLLGYGHGLGTIAFAPLTPAAPVSCSSVASGSQFAASGFSIANANLSPGYWTLRTVSRSSVSGELTTVETPFSVTDQPLAPTNFSVTAAGNTLTVSFSAPTEGPPPGRYALDAGSDPTLSRPSFTLDLPGPGSFSGTLGNGTWHFRVTSLRADGLRGGATRIISLVLPGGAPPPAPPGPPVLNPAAVNGNNVSLTWAPGPGGAPTSYTIIAGSTPGSSSVGTFPMGGATSISSPVGNGVYFVRVQASNSSGSAISNEITFTIGATSLPGVPTLNPASVSGGNVTLTWTTPSGSPTAYTIRARSSPAGPIIASLPVTGNMVTVPAPPGTYLVTILATNSLGSSPESNQITVVVP